MTDPLPEVKARRVAVPDPPYEIEDTVTEEEFYMRWRLIHYGPPDEDGWRDWWAALPAARADHAEFIAHAPADIDTLIGEVERLRAEVAEWKQAASAEADLADERSRTIARLRGLLGRLEWAGGLVTFPDGCEPCCPACEVEEADSHDHEPGCWLAAELVRNANDPPEGSQP
jgi:hypothetical protein